MSKVEIKKQWEFDEIQCYETRTKKYYVHEAIRLSKDLPVKEINLSEIYMSYGSMCKDSFRSFLEHVKMVNDADLSCPILMNEDGCIIDGRHRLAKAILDECETIKVKRFVDDPADCFDWI